jgi:hypothetical protein
VGQLTFWSVERDGDAIVATCPEPLRAAGEHRPGWMTGCAAAIRDELRSLAIGDGTLLEATLAGEPPAGGDLAGVLLAGAGVPESQLQAGVRLRRLPPEPGVVVQRYRRAAIAAEPAESGELLVAVSVPCPEGQELETARRAVAAALPEDPAAPPAGSTLRVHLVEAGRRRGSAALVGQLLAGAGPSSPISAADVTFSPGAEARLEIELRAPPGA